MFSFGREFLNLILKKKDRSMNTQGPKSELGVIRPLRQFGLLEG